MALIDHMRGAAHLEDGTLLFCSGPVWIGISIAAPTTEAEILAALEQLSRYVRVAAKSAPRPSPES